MLSRYASKLVFWVLFDLSSAAALFAANTLTVGPGETFTKIGDAIAAAADGDTVLVKAGTYAEAINFAGKKITVHSEAGKETTTIDATGIANSSVVAFRTKETADSVLEGFTITGGTGFIISGANTGGGILIDGASPTVRSSTVTKNTARKGGGIAVQGVNSGGLFEDCEVSENMATGATGPAGAGIYTLLQGTAKDQSLVIRRTVFRGNWTKASGAAQGGGAYLGGSNALATITLTGCTVTGSAIGVANPPTTSAGEGGGIYAATVKLVVEGGEVSGNTALNGGGMAFLNISAASVIGGTDAGRLLVKDNKALGGGGGIYFPATTSTRPTLSLARIEGNLAPSTTATLRGGGGILFDGGAPVIQDCELVGNTAGENGGGIRQKATATKGTILRTRFEGNKATEGGGIYVSSASTVPVVYGDCIFTKNTATTLGGAIYNKAPTAAAIIKVFYCDIVGNTSTSGIGGIHFDTAAAQALVRNCVLWDNKPSDYPADQSTKIASCDVKLPAKFPPATKGMLNVDPGFVDPTVDPPNFDLKPDSPLVDAGEVLADADGAAIAEDLAGRTRVTDGNGDGKSLPDMGAFELPGGAPPAEGFIRGDANGDGRVDLTDAIAVLGTLFQGTGALPCDDSGDANDDGRLDLTDPIAMLATLFQGAGALPPPSDACGVDPTADSLPPCTLRCP